jgi:hypothetical protein
VVSTLLLSSSCTTHRLSTDPDPPLSSADYGALWLAVGAVVVLLAAHGVRALATTRRPLRLAAAGIIATWVAGVAVLALGIVAVDVRTVTILDGDECHSVPVVERPESIVALSCTEGVDAGFGTVVALFYLGFAAAPAALAVAALRGQGRWSAAIPGFVITAAAVAGLFKAVSLVRTANAPPEDTGALVLALSGLVAGGMLLADAARTWRR